MWAFFSALLESGGLTALMFGFVSFVAYLSGRALWKHNQELHEKLTEAQESRVSDAQEMSDRFIEHVRKMDRSLDRIVHSMATLVEVSRSRRG